MKWEENVLQSELRQGQMGASQGSFVLDKVSLGGLSSYCHGSGQTLISPSWCILGLSRARKAWRRGKSVRPLSLLHVPTTRATKLKQTSASWGCFPNK